MQDLLRFATIFLRLFGFKISWFASICYDYVRICEGLIGFLSDKGPSKRGHIVADTLLPTQMFPRLHARATFVTDTNFVSETQKNVSDFVQKHFVSGTNVSQFAQHKKHHEQQCVLVCQGLYIVTHDVSRAAQTGKHLLPTQNVSEQKSETFFVSRTQNLCPQQLLRTRANGETFVSATMCPQQCVLVCQGLNVKNCSDFWFWFYAKIC